MKFELTMASLKHSGFTALLNVAALGAGYWWSGREMLIATAPMLCFAGFLFYVGREVRDIEKSHGGNLRTWNSAELIAPLAISLAMAAAISILGGQFV